MFSYNEVSEQLRSTLNDTGNVLGALIDIIEDLKWNISIDVISWFLMQVLLPKILKYEATVNFHKRKECCYFQYY